MPRAANRRASRAAGPLTLLPGCGKADTAADEAPAQQACLCKSGPGRDFLYITSGKHTLARIAGRLLDDEASDIKSPGLAVLVSDLIEPGIPCPLRGNADTFLESGVGGAIPR